MYQKLLTDYTSNRKFHAHNAKQPDLIYYLQRKKLGLIVLFYDTPRMRCMARKTTEM